MQDRDRRELIGKLLDETAAARAAAGTDAAGTVVVLVVAGLLADGSSDLLADALRVATSTPDRHLVAIASSYLAGDHDRVIALAGDHLMDHPSRPVLTWILDHSHPVEPEDPA